MLLQQQIFDEIKHIPENKLTELYNLIHYFRLGLQYEAQQPQIHKNKYPLRGTVINYQSPTDPVALSDWDTLK
jgi:hypothetical protein